MTMNTIVNGGMIVRTAAYGFTLLYAKIDVTQIIPTSIPKIPKMVVLTITNSVMTAVLVRNRVIVIGASIATTVATGFSIPIPR